MGKVIYGMAVSLDGFIEAPGADLSWSNPDAELHQHFNDQENENDILLYGRKLYETMAAYWPTGDQDPNASPVEKEYARIWRSKPKVVFSRTLDKVEWNSRLVKDNVAAEVTRLKAEPGKKLSVGGAGLAGTLIQLGLVDEFSLYLFPVLLGAGTRLFPLLDERINLRLVETHTFTSRVVLLKYERAEE